MIARRREMQNFGKRETIDVQSSSNQQNCRRCVREHSTHFPGCRSNCLVRIVLHFSAASSSARQRVFSRIASRRVRSRSTEFGPVVVIARRHMPLTVNSLHAAHAIGRVRA